MLCTINIKMVLFKKKKLLKGKLSSLSPKMSGNLTTLWPVHSL